MTFIARLLVLSPTYLGCWRFGIDPESKPFHTYSMSADAAGETKTVLCFAEMMLMPHPRLFLLSIFNVCSFYLAYKRQLVDPCLRENASVCGLSPEFTASN